MVERAAAAVDFISFLSDSVVRADTNCVVNPKQINCNKTIKMSCRQKQAAAVMFLLQEEEEKKRRCWERDWIARRKQKAGLYRELLNELKEEDAAAY